jgi:3-oxoacyl-[acyl-carrier-protein] synthase-3
MNIRLLGSSHRLGSNTIDAESIENRFKRDPGTIAALSGVTRLHRIAPHESLVSLAADAAHDVLAKLGLSLAQVTGLFSSCNPTTDFLIPSLAPMVAAQLNLSHLLACNIGMGCAGGVQAFQAAYNQLVVDAHNGKVSYYLVVAGDHISRMIDHDSWKTAILFSDGVAVSVVTNDPAATGGWIVERVESECYAGENIEVINLPNVLAREQPGERPTYMLQMRGRGVFEFGTRVAPRVRELAGIESFEECYIVPHQANIRMIRELVPAFNIREDQLYMDGITTVGNISGAACFIGFEDALQRNLCPAASRVLLVAFGAELQVAVAVLRRS